MNIFDVIESLTKFVDFEEGSISWDGVSAWTATIPDHGTHTLSITDSGDAAGAMAEADSYWLTQGHKRIVPWFPGGAGDYSCFVAI